MRTLAMLCFTAGLGAGACAVQTGPGHPGGGPQVEQDREVAPFTRIALAGGFDADIIVGAPQTVTLGGDLDVIEGIETEVAHGRLTVRFPHGLVKSGGVRVTIITPQLTEIETDGASDLDIDGLRGESFALEVNGASTANLDGEVGALRAEINGAATLDSTALNARTVRLEVNGSGRADVTALAALDVEINGAGRVRYRGEPTVAKEINGAGRVKPL